MTNRLAQETSPYLLQHKDNPVDWYPWGPEALAKAKDEDKPLLVSIGYSACHWCHVMEHESFEDERVAAVMNENFVNVKVDREERPDLDSIYMTAVQAMTGHGGWPLNVFLTPDGVPFYGGTYFPPEDRPGIPSFLRVLDAVSDAYRNQHDQVEQNKAQLEAFLVQSSAARPADGDLTPDILDEAFDSLLRSFDAEHGGFGGAPKFPQPAVLEFLLRQSVRGQDERAAGMVRLTLEAMADGGIYDQIGGGFARYTVDANWLVPHFEKMLYDNAQLARLYLDAYRAEGAERFRQVAEETLDYVVREMTSPEGGFYATQDADSEGEEGKFYLWTADEIAAVLDPAEAELATAYFGVTADGNFEGKTILHVARPLAEVARDLETSTKEAAERLASAKQKLLEARDDRVHPGRDEKILASWNGLMLRAFAEGSRVLDRPDLLDVARKSATFLLDRLRDGDHLLHTYKDGQARIPGFLDDYACVIDGLVALYQASFERQWIDEALRLARIMVAEFADPAGGFFDTGSQHETLVARPRDLQDGATPAGNSVAADVLLRLATMTEDEGFQAPALDVLRMMARPMAEQPLGFGRYLCALDYYLAAQREVAIAGPAADPAIAAFAREVYRRYEPNTILGLADPADQEITEELPFLAYRPMQRGLVTAYLCEHHACLPPVTDPEDLAIQLEQGTGISWQEL